MDVEAKRQLRELAKEDEEYLSKIRHMQKKRMVDTKRILREKEGRRLFFRRRMVKDGYEDGKFFSERNFAEAGNGN